MNDITFHRVAFKFAFVPVHDVHVFVVFEKTQI